VFSVAEQRYQAVLAVIADGLSVRQVAEKVGVSRQSLHTWLARYEAEGLDGLGDRSRRPHSCPHQIGAEVEAVVLELRRVHRYWGPRRIRHELARRALVPARVMPSESAIYKRLDKRYLRYDPFSRTSRDAAARLPLRGSDAVLVR
jgi:transposase